MPGSLPESLVDLVGDCILQCHRHELPRVVHERRPVVIVVVPLVELLSHVTQCLEGTLCPLRHLAEGLNREVDEFVPVVIRLLLVLGSLGDTLRL